MSSPADQQTGSSWESWWRPPVRLQYICRSFASSQDDAGCNSWLWAGVAAASYRISPPSLKEISTTRTKSFSVGVHRRKPIWSLWAVMMEKANQKFASATRTCRKSALDLTNCLKQREKFSWLGRISASCLKNRKGKEEDQPVHFLLVRLQLKTPIIKNQKDNDV